MDFKVCEEVSALGVKVAFLVINNIDNNIRDELLKKEIENFYIEFTQNYSPENLENDANIIGYRKLHEKIDIADKSLVASPESLIKLLFKYKTLRPINFIVDTYALRFINVRHVCEGGADQNRKKYMYHICITVYFIS